jgi:hypothetical protein
MAVVSIRKAYAGHARRVMMGVWSHLRQFMYTKFIVVVDDDVDVRDWKEVIWAITTRMDPARDTMMVEHTPIDYLDFASPVSGLGSKMGMDATNKWPGETQREWGRRGAGRRQQDVDVLAGGEGMRSPAGSAASPHHVGRPGAPSLDAGVLKGFRAPGPRPSGQPVDVDLHVFQRHGAAHQRLAARAHRRRQRRGLVGAVVDRPCSTVHTHRPQPPLRQS